MRNAPTLTIVCFLLISGCASSSSTFYNRDRLALVNTWEVVFAYESGEVEQSVSPEGQSSRVMKTGQLRSDLQLRDDIFFRLMDKHNISLTKDPKTARGQIRLHAVHFASGGFKSVDVSLYDADNELLARVRVKNGDRNATFKEDDSFAEYAADEIADILSAR